jgi:hypothetical protein
VRALGLPIALWLAGCSFKVISEPAGGDGDGAPGVPLKKRIAIDPARVDGAHAQFPVWIALVDGELAAGASQGGADIYFTDEGGAALPHQIQRWDQETGRLEAWVRVDLSDTAETVLELRYGDPRPAAAPSPPTVFSNSFAAVWHLDDRLDTMEVSDARGERPGAALGGLGTSHQVAAQLGGGVDFDGMSTRIEFANPFLGNVDHTFSAWVNQRTAAGCDTIVMVGNSAGQRSRFLYSHFLGGVYTGFYANDWQTPVASIQDAGWILLHWTYKGATRVGRIYRDGAEVAPHTFSGAGGGPNTLGTGGYLGYTPPQWNPDQTNPCALNGILDEVRLATVERTAGWIATEHANQSSPQTFYTVGREEPAPP